MGRDRQAPLLGLALLHGLPEVEAVRDLAVNPGPIMTLRHRGPLDPADATALLLCLEGKAVPSGRGPGQGR